MTRVEILAKVASGESLAGANLQGANLKEANLKEANLQGANLEWADLQGAYLQGANLRRAIFYDTNTRVIITYGKHLIFNKLGIINLDNFFLAVNSTLVDKHLFYSTKQLASKLS